MRTRTLLATLSLLAPAALPAQPPAADVLSGKAITALAEKLAGRKAAPGVEPEKPLDEKKLKALNLLTPDRLEVGFVSRAHQIEWPEALQAFRADREAFCKLLPEAVKLARKGKIPPKTLKQLTTRSKALDEQLAAMVADLAPIRYIEAKRFLNRLDAALGALGKADVSAHLRAADRLLVEGRSAPELASFLAARKLKVGPVVQGSDAAAYREIYQALADYEKRAARGGKK
jgi:hypothetical protein